MYRVPPRAPENIVSIDEGHQMLVYLLFWMSYNQGYELGLAVDAPIWTDQVTEVPHLSTRPVARSVPTS